MRRALPNCSQSPLHFCRLSLASRAQPGLCLVTDPKAPAAAFAPCNASDSSQWIKTPPITSMNSTISNIGDDNSVLSIMDAGFIAHAGQAFDLACNSAGICNEELAIQFPSFDSTGAAGDVTMRFSTYGESFDGIDSPLPMEIYKSSFISLLYTQYQANSGNIPTNFYLFGGQNLDNLAQLTLNVNISFALPPPASATGRSGCSAAASNSMYLVGGLVSLAAAIIGPTAPYALPIIGASVGVGAAICSLDSSS